MVEESKLPGYVFDSSVWRGNLSDKSTKLEQLVAKVAIEEREAEASMMAERESIEKYDDAFTCTANIVSSLLQIAGERELVARVHPSTCRSGQTEEVGREAGQAAGQAAD